MRIEFLVAVDAGDSTTAARLLCEVGADVETAWNMIAILIPAERDDPPAARD